MLFLVSLTIKKNFDNFLTPLTQNLTRILKIMIVTKDQLALLKRIGGSRENKEIEAE